MTLYRFCSDNVDMCMVRYEMRHLGNRETQSKARRMSDSITSLANCSLGPPAPNYQEAWPQRHCHTQTPANKTASWNMTAGCVGVVCTALVQSRQYTWSTLASRTGARLEPERLCVRMYQNSSSLCSVLAKDTVLRNVKPVRTRVSILPVDGCCTQAAGPPNPHRCEGSSITQLMHVSSHSTYHVVARSTDRSAFKRSCRLNVPY
jgi:hypothetical protein